jgi:hypothetical protein
MSTREIAEFYCNADTCRRNALATSDPDAKNVWLQLAKDWQSLAKSSAATIH